MKEVIISQDQNSKIYAIKIDENIAQIIEEIRHPEDGSCLFFSSKIVLRKEYEALKKLFEGE